jgi:hypothetical protein
VPTTYQDAITRVLEKTQTTSTAFANWTADQKLRLINDGVFETHKLLVSLMQWLYFVDIEEGIVPAGNAISLDSLPKPFYSLLSMARYPYTEGCDVTIRTIRDTYTNQLGDEGWFQVGKVLRSDSTSTLAGPYRISYNYLPPRVTSSDLNTPLPLDEEYVDMPSLWAAKECMSDAGFNDHYAKLEGQWIGRKSELERTAAKRNPAQQIRILDKMGWSRRGYPRGLIRRT